MVTPEQRETAMRYVLLLAAALAACAPANPPPVLSLAPQAERAAPMPPSSLRERDALVRQEAILAAQSGQPLQPVIQRQAEENVRDGVAPTPLGRHRPAQVIHFEKARLMDVASNAISAMNTRTVSASAFSSEQMRRQAYCRSLAADIAIPTSDGADLITRMIGIRPARESSLYQSCIGAFDRNDAYLGR
jgi:hypothetical protein